MRRIDTCAHANRWSGRHPLEKAFLAFGMLAVVLAAPPLTTAPVAVIVVALAACWGAGVPPRTFALVLALPAGFLAASAPLLAVSLETTPSLALRFDPDGAAAGAVLAVRSIGAAACLAFLVLTTPMTDLVGLLRRVGVPAVVVELMFLMYRFTFLLADTLRAGYLAQAGRGGYTGFGRSLRSAGSLGGTLFLHTLDRARRLERGLASRGFDGEFRTLARRRPADAARIGLFALAIAATAATGTLAGGWFQ